MLRLKIAFDGYASIGTVMHYILVISIPVGHSFVRAVGQLQLLQRKKQLSNAAPLYCFAAENDKNLR